MKRLVSMMLLLAVMVAASGCFGFYVKPYRLETGYSGSGEVSAMSARAWEVKPVYYGFESLDGGGAPVQLRVVDAIGQDLPNPVWEPVDPEYGTLYFSTDGSMPPNCVDFLPKKRGEVIIAATQDDFTATAKVIVLPTDFIMAGKSFDFDGDGQADFAVQANGSSFSFPFGAVKTDVLVHPFFVDQITDDYPAPSSEPLNVDNPDYHLWTFVFNGSSGGVYMACITGYINNSGQLVTWRKLRDAA